LNEVGFDVEIVGEVFVVDGVVVVVVVVVVAFVLRVLFVEFLLLGHNIQQSFFLGN